MSSSLHASATYAKIPADTLAAQRLVYPERFDEGAIFRRLLSPLADHGPEELAARDPALAGLWSWLPASGRFDWLCEVNDAIAARLGPPTGLSAWLTAPALYKMTQVGWICWSFPVETCEDLEWRPFPITDAWLCAVAETHSPGDVVSYIRALRDESRARGAYLGLRTAAGHAGYAFSRGLVRGAGAPLKSILAPGQTGISAHDRLQASAMIAAAGPLNLREMTATEAIERVETALGVAPADPETFQRIVRALAIQAICGNIPMSEQERVDLSMQFL